MIGNQDIFVPTTETWSIFWKGQVFHPYQFQQFYYPIINRLSYFKSPDPERLEPSKLDELHIEQFKLFILFNIILSIKLPFASK